MKILVWHWGRRGAGPLFALRLTEAINQLPGYQADLSLPAGAEILHSQTPPKCIWAEPTYQNLLGYLAQKTFNVFFASRTLRKLIQIKPDFAICAMPSLLDRRLLKALASLKIPYAVVVHDAAAHPGESLSFRMLDQSRLLRGARCLVTLSAHVAADLQSQNYGVSGQHIIKLWHPPFSFGAQPMPPLAHAGLPRVLFFGRLLASKGLDLLADALSSLGPDLPFVVKICGDGPVSSELIRLQTMHGVEIDRRWIPESELPGLLAWSDVVVLPYSEASQSGVAAAAMAQGRYVLATRVGGLVEQLSDHALALLVEPNAVALAAGFSKIFELTNAVAPIDPEADWQNMASKMLSICSDHVNQPNPDRVPDSNA